MGKCKTKAIQTDLGTFKYTKHIQTYPGITQPYSLASDRAILNGNDVFSILVASTKKKYSSFLKKVFVFQKICFKVKVLKMFETFIDCHIKTC